MNNNFPFVLHIEGPTFLVVVVDSSANIRFIFRQFMLNLKIKILKVVVLKNNSNTNKSILFSI